MQMDLAEWITGAKVTHGDKEALVGEGRVVRVSGEVAHHGYLIRHIVQRHLAAACPSRTAPCGSDGAARGPCARHASASSHMGQALAIACWLHVPAYAPEGGHRRRGGGDGRRRRWRRSRRRRLRHRRGAERGGRGGGRGHWPPPRSPRLHEEDEISDRGRGRASTMS